MSGEKEFHPLIFKVKVAEQTERYDDMVKFAVELVKLRHEEKVPLSIEERNWLSAAYKSVIGSRRSAWRVTSSIEKRESNRDKPETAQKLSIIQDYKLRVEKELDEICEQILAVVDKYLLGTEEVVLMSESKVFYYKMKGDYCRYMAEYKAGDKQKEASDRAAEAYKEAQYIAEQDPDAMECTNPIKLGLALNFSVFQYEIQKNTEEACKLAKKAFDDAITDLDSLGDEKYRDSTMIMGLLRDNLTLWTSESQADDQIEEGAPDY